MLLVMSKKIGQTDTRVNCYATPSLCNGGRVRDPEPINIRRCCLELGGLAFQVEGNEECQRCVGKSN